MVSTAARPLAAARFDVRLITRGGVRLPLEFRPATSFAGDPAPRTTPAAALRAPARQRQHLRWASRFLLILSLLQLLDMASTLLLRSIGGVEVNPVAAWSLGIGVPAFVALKLALAALLAAFVPLLERERRPLRGTTLACLGFDVAFGLVVASNLAQFLLFA